MWYDGIANASMLLFTSNKANLIILLVVRVQNLKQTSETNSEFCGIKKKQEIKNN